MKRFCPCCGQQMITGAPAEFMALVESLSLPRRQRQVVDRLMASWPRQVSGAALVEHLFADDEDASNNELGCVQTHVCKLRVRLERHGWTIRNRRFEGYHIERMSAQTVRRAA